MRLHTAFFGINSLLVATLLISGCSLFKKRNTNAQLIPPSANGLQAPIYPPTNFTPRKSIQPLPSPRLENNDQPIISSNPTNAIPNTPILTPNNVIELNAVGMGVAPESTISPSQALALAKRAAIVDGYRQLGEKMYGIRVNAQDTVKDMVLQNSVIKTRVNALIRNAEITETIYKDGLCQVS
ncbi:LPP20 family lipoprotein, partial [Helicobacter pylori]